MDSKRPVLGIVGGVFLVFGGLALGVAPFQFALADGGTTRPVTVVGIIASGSLILAGVGVLLWVTDVVPRVGPDLSTVAGGVGIIISLVTFLSGIEVTLGGELYGVLGGFLSVLWKPSGPETEQQLGTTRPQVVIALVMVVGFLLVTNPVWLFPHDGETEYTYQRAQLVIDNESISYTVTDEILTEEIRETGYIENGTVAYRRVIDSLSGELTGDLNGIACEEHDPQSRACAFDAYLVSQGPVHLRNRASFDTQHAFIYYNNSYYRRIDRDHDTNNSVTYDVKRIRPRELLAGMAENLSEYSEDRLRSDWTSRLVMTGEAKTSFRAPSNNEIRTLREENIGNVYRYNGDFYTVIVAGERVEYPVISPGMRAGLIIIGVALWIYLA